MHFDMIPGTTDQDCDKYEANVLDCKCKNRREFGRFEMPTDYDKPNKRGDYIDPYRGDAICKHIFHRRCETWYCYDSVAQRHQAKKQGIRAQVIDRKASRHQAVQAQPQAPKRRSYTEQERKELGRLLKRSTQAC